ncbi:MAG: hypothetical protein E6Q97_39030 [Desulfurellales bacterium]|nr:MAG: hypothetical protein E6Q97_39030 [Desulfurellales bacterium]
MPAKKKLTPPASSRRNRWLRCRVNAAEEAEVLARIAALDPESAQIEGAQIAERLRTAAPFNGPGAFLRAVLGLPAIERGAPKGNNNRTAKREKKHAH